MDAKKAREITEENTVDVVLNSDSSGEEIRKQMYEIVLETLSDGIAERAKKGKSSIVTEPWVHIPGKLHPQDVENSIMVDVSKALAEKGFQPMTEDDEGNVSFWDRTDGRIVCRFSW